MPKPEVADELQQLREELKRKEEELKHKDQELKHKDQELKHKDQELKDKDEQHHQELQPYLRTTLRGFLRNCHLSTAKRIIIARTKLLASQTATNVDGKWYPLHLRLWDDFEDIQSRCFNRIHSAFGDKKLLPSSTTTHTMGRMACPYPVADEGQVIQFDKFALEAPVRLIFEHMVEADPLIRQEYNFTELQISNYDRELQPPTLPDEAEDAAQEKRNLRPDGFGFRRDSQEGSLAFVYEYKAAHKVAFKNLKLVLANDKLFVEAAQRTRDQAISTDAAQKDQNKSATLTAKAMTQVFDYMIRRGLQFGYVSSGKAVIFLHVKPDKLRTLYYYPCVQDELPVDENGNFEESQTTVSQLACFCLHTLQFYALQGPQLNELKSRAAAELMEWPNAYEEAEQLEQRTSLESSEPSQSSEGSEYPPDDGPDSVLTMVLRSGAGKKRKERPSSGSSENTGRQGRQDTASQCTRSYCTQACLLGLKTGRNLDENCPNICSHRVVEGDTQHPINSNEFISLVGRQLHQNPYNGCVALDPYGLLGKIGLIGALFKLELVQYGYTFVGKGTQLGHLHYLEHESAFYERLEKLQGEVVPVYLGIVDLPRPWGYVLPGDADIIHMMLMSWGGEVASISDVPNLDAELSRSLVLIRKQGVNHGDEREPNMLWNQERNRVMVIDFHRASFVAKGLKKSRMRGLKRQRENGVWKRHKLDRKHDVGP